MNDDLIALDLYTKQLMKKYEEKLDAKGKEVLGNLRSTSTRLNELVGDLFQQWLGSDHGPQDHRAPRRPDLGRKLSRAGSDLLFHPPAVLGIQPSK